LVNISGAGSIAITESSGSILIHGASGNGTLSITGNNVIVNHIQHITATGSLSINAVSSLNKILSFVGNGTLVITALCEGEILGEQWVDVVVVNDTEWSYQ
jgi:hypothetical protein